MDDLIFTVHWLTIIVSSGMLLMCVLLVVVVFMAWRIDRQSEEHKVKLEQLVHQFNSKMDQLLEAKRAEGVREGEGGRGPAAAIDVAPQRPTGF